MGPAIKAHLQPEYDAAVNKLDNDADTVANKFKQGATNENVRELVAAGLIPLSAAGFYPGLELTSADKRSYYEATLGTMSAQEQIDWINRHKDDLPPEAADAIRPEVQEQFANDVADDIKDLDDIDEDTVRAASFFQEPASLLPPALHRRSSPDQMSAAVAHLSHQAFPNSSTGRDRTPSRTPSSTRASWSGRCVLRDLHEGHGLLRPAGRPRDTYYNAITDEENPQNAAALTLLIRHGGQETSLDDGVHVGADRQGSTSGSASTTATRCGARSTTLSATTGSRTPRSTTATTRTSPTTTSPSAARRTTAWPTCWAAWHTPPRAPRTSSWATTRAAASRSRRGWTTSSAARTPARSPRTRATDSAGPCRRPPWATTPATRTARRSRTSCSPRSPSTRARATAGVRTTSGTSGTA